MPAFWSKASHFDASGIDLSVSLSVLHFPGGSLADKIDGVTGWPGIERD